MPKCSHDNTNKTLLPILGHDKTTQKLSGGNINDSCEDGMITSYTSSQQTQASSLFEFIPQYTQTNKQPNNHSIHSMKIL